MSSSKIHHDWLWTAASQELRQTMESNLTYMDERGEHSAKVYEAEGGYAPTIESLERCSD